MTISFTLLVRMAAAFQVVAFQEMSQKQSSGNQLETQTRCLLASLFGEGKLCKTYVSFIRSSVG